MTRAGDILGLLLFLCPLIARADQAEIAIRGFQFSPAEITVPAGTTVTWVNRDDAPHSVADQAGRFRSGGLDTDDIYSFTLSKAGTYTYYCTLHPQMTGTIHVR